MCLYVQTSNTVQGERGLYKFLKAVLPEDVPYDKKGLKTQSKQEFLEDVFKGIKAVSMAVRITSVPSVKAAR